MSLKNVWGFFKRHPKKLVLFYLLVAWVTAVYTTKRNNDQYCKETTEALGGGVHHYGGQDYTFTLCGSLFTTRFGTFGSNIKSIRLQIHDTQNELWAERVFDVYPSAASNGLSYEKSSVTYTGGDENGVFGGEISMPPSRWEWLKVRVVHAFWGVMESIFVKPLKWVFSLIY